MITTARPGWIPCSLCNWAVCSVMDSASRSALALPSIRLAVIEFVPCMGEKRRTGYSLCSGDATRDNPKFATRECHNMIGAPPARSTNGISRRRGYQAIRDAFALKCLLPTPRALANALFPPSSARRTGFRRFCDQHDLLVPADLRSRAAQAALADPRASDAHHARAHGNRRELDQRQ